MRRIRTAAFLLCLGATVLAGNRNAVAQGVAGGDQCAKAKTAHDALYAELSKNPKLREMARSDAFVALEDGGDGTLWTFTLPAHPAHPSVVCRRIVERRGVLDIPTTIECKASEQACAKLKSDFDMLNERVISDLYAKQKTR
jgi:hypothetical protein